MNILLVNTDAVVTRLLTLSTQKTNDRLDIASSLEEIREESYDLLILDGSLFSREFLEALNDKVLYAHSLLITTRESAHSELFEKQLYKPFLPTELLVLLHQFAKQVSNEEEALAKEIDFSALEERLFEGDEKVEEKIEAPLVEEVLTEVIETPESIEPIFSDEEVFEVKAILDALQSDEEEDRLVDEVITDPDPLSEIDLELEKALQNFHEKIPVENGSEDNEAEVPQVANASEQQSLSEQNRASIETLQTLVKALENPQIARSLRGTITINLTFGED